MMLITAAMVASTAAAAPPPPPPSPSAAAPPSYMGSGIPHHYFGKLRTDSNGYGLPKTAQYGLDCRKGARPHLG